MSNTTGAQGGADLLENPEACTEQRQRTRAVEKELKRLTNRLERDKIASIFHMQVYGFNCSDKRHSEKSTIHVDYVGGGTSRLEDAGAVQSVIHALEHALNELRKRVQ